MHRVAWKSIRDEVVSSRSAKLKGTTSSPDTQVPAGAADEVKTEPATERQIKALEALLRASATGKDEFDALLQERFGYSSQSELSRPQASSLLVELQRNERERLARL